jgi:hypothetical protein
MVSVASDVDVYIKANHVQVVTAKSVFEIDAKTDRVVTYTKKQGIAKMLGKTSGHKLAA